MSRIVKIYRTLRNNWKKTVFFSGLASYGANWGYGKYIEFNLMKEFSEEAVKYGQIKLPPFLPTRHVTVILNPVANKRKSKADYEKYCAPLFHLAGLKVSVVTTETEGQAKDLTEIMDNTDCIVVAGGDGTVHEVLTGLLRRNDSHIASKRFPIGILPVGKSNRVAYKLNSAFNEKDRKAKILGESSMAVVRQVLSGIDVMRVEGDQGRPVFTIGQLSIGQIRNTISKLDQYWYFGQTMKPYLTFFFQSFKNLAELWDEKKQVKVSYTKPCSGCSKCYQLYTDLPQQSSADSSVTGQSSSRWWHMFLPRNRPQNQIPDPKALELERMKNTENDECDKWQSLEINSKNIIIQNQIGDSEIQMIIHPSDLKRSQFFKEGIRICKNKEFEGNGEPPFQVLSGKDYIIKLPVVEMQNSEMPDQTAKQSNELATQIEEQQFATKSAISEDISGSFELAGKALNSPNAIKELDQEEPDVIMETEPSADQPSTVLEDEVEQNQWFSIDNESYEYQSTLRISLLPRKVQIYHSR